MDKNLKITKGLVFAIIVLFVGIGIIPMVSSSPSSEKSGTSIKIGEYGSRNNDTTPPVTTATLDPPEPNENGWYRTMVWVTLNATDNESGVNVTYYQINDEGWGIYTHSFFVPEYGFIVVEFYSIDNAGNAEIPKQVDFKVDIMDPMTFCSFDPPYPDGTNGWYISNITITLNATDDLSGVNVTCYTANGDPWKIYTSPFVIYNEMIFGYYSIDNAGNQEHNPHHPIIRMDKEPPMIVLNKQVMFNKIVYIAVPSDNMSGVAYVEFYFNGVLQFTAISPGPYEWTLTPIPHINGLVKAIAYDMAGNNASTSTTTQNSYNQSQQTIQHSQQSNQLLHNLLYNLMLRHQMMS
jgi:hypothetical protein